jgi:hypothetical protein
MIPNLHTHTHTHTHTSSFFLSIFLVIILMRWHEWLFQPSVSPAATSSIGVPRWPATSHTGASLQHCNSIIFLRLVRYWPSLPRSALLTPSGVAWVARHHPSLPLARHWPSLWEASLLRQPCRFPRWRGTGRASGTITFDNLAPHPFSPPTGEALAEPLGGFPSTLLPPLGTE